jgi:hypothetical protein
LTLRTVSLAAFSISAGIYPTLSNRCSRGVLANDHGPAILLSEFLIFWDLANSAPDAVHCGAQVPTFGLRKNGVTLEENSHDRDEPAALMTEVAGVAG